MVKNLLIVESPSKAHTIEAFMGKDYKVVSSAGHFRKDVKVDVDHDFAITYEIDPERRKIVADLKKAAKAADVIWLASDDDREGEAIAWHLKEVLGLPDDTHRITYTSIDKDSVTEAIAHPRTINMDMVASQQARQSLDYLVGYDLSMVVRRKVPGAVSAGRVQSPALRLVVEREREIDNFDKKFNFKVSGVFCADGSTASKNASKPSAATANKNADDSTSDADTFTATLEKTELPTATAAKALLETLKGATFTVSSVDQTEGRRANPVPLTTASLQIEANSRLGFSSSTTMRAAQALYQAGMITYHRTDSLNLSNKALGAIAHYVETTFGKNYLQVRHFHTKDANAQEAHEAIRPTNIAREVAGKNDFERRLYHLIRTRTLATQMANARVAKTTVILTPSTAPQTQFTAKGEVVVFDGFLKVYGASKDLELPALHEGQTVTAQTITARQNFAKPPARYTEGSLVKKLRELGIGRPSTYATIMSAIQARGYVIKGEGEGRSRKVEQYILENDTIRQENTTEKSGATKGKLLPTPSGELVSDFLVANFQNIVDYDFTAGVENQLDLIAQHKLGRVEMLRAFYGPFQEEVRAAEDSERFNGARELGIDPKSGRPIFAKIGRHGGYLQVGVNSGKSTGGRASASNKGTDDKAGTSGKNTSGHSASNDKPDFYSLPAGTTVKTVTLEQALQQMALPQLPRTLGTLDDGSPLIVAAGPFGPYVKGGLYSAPLKVTGAVIKKAEELHAPGEYQMGATFDPYTIDFATALPFYRAKVDAIVHDWGDIQVVLGAYGPYVKGPGRYNNVKIPEGTDPQRLTMEEAEKMLANKPKTRRRAPRRRAAKRATAKKAAKGTATKKTTKSTATKRGTKSVAKGAVAKRNTSKRATAGRSTKTARKTTSSTGKKATKKS